MEASMELSKVHGPYETFKGSPVSKGIFQFDMWNVTPKSGRWNWEQLKRDVKQFGVRNSLLLAPMPTASTSQIFGNNECFEPYTSNIYTRRTLSGEFIIANKHLMKDLMNLGLWSDNMSQKSLPQMVRFSLSQKFLRILKTSIRRFGKFRKSLSLTCRPIVALTFASHKV